MSPGYSVGSTKRVNQTLAKENGCLKSLWSEMHVLLYSRCPLLSLIGVFFIFCLIGRLNIEETLCGSMVLLSPPDPQLPPRGLLGRTGLLLRTSLSYFRDAGSQIVPASASSRVGAFESSSPGHPYSSFRDLALSTHFGGWRGHAPRYR
jgi:hypothetical protein